MIKVRALEPRDASAWNRLVERSRHASFYHLLEWGEALSSTYGYRRYYLLAEQDGDLVGAFPSIYVESTIFSNRLISLPLCQHGGPLVDPSLENSIQQQVIIRLLTASDRLAMSLGAEYIEVRGLSSEVASILVNDLGYTCFKRYVTFRVNLAEPVEVLWRNLNKKTRNAARKAMKRGVQVIEARNAGQLEAYYSLYLRAQKRLGSPPHAYRFFRNLFDTFCQKHRMKIILAIYRGKPIAGNIYFNRGNTIYWGFNVTEVEHRHLNPTNLLLWKTIECGSKNDREVLDLGKTRPKSTTHHFKKGWGGKEVILNDCMRFFGKVRIPPDPGQGKYIYLSRLWSLIPVAAARRWGPSIISEIAT